ncbi:phosphoenolpyruvate--protein phosphotransferase, partial [Lachnotalea glycerini]
MIVLEGKSVFNDICMGNISFYKRKESVIKRYKVEDTDAEIKRFESAKEKGKKQLQSLYEKALADVGEANAAIFEIHQMMLEDLDYCESIINIINSQQVNAEYAVGVTADNFTAMFAAMDDAYMQGRAADVKDVSERLLKILTNAEDGIQILNDKVVIAADDLVPSETVQLDKDKVLGFIMQNGSANSHTAILARSMGIPAIIGLGEDLKKEFDGKYVIVDGFHGKVYIEPDEETLAVMEKRRKESLERKELLQQLKDKEDIT